MRVARGFTLLELVVAITISSIVIIFVSMFLSAPVEAYMAHARRNGLVADAASAWPRLEADLRSSLPNSVRARRNGTIVALEFLHVVDGARYIQPTTAPFATAGVFRNIVLPFDSTAYYLSVNNMGTPGATAYVPGATLTASGSSIHVAAGPQPGETSVTVTPTPAFIADSPRRQVYLVSGPVTYLCDEVQGTLQRYDNYPIQPNQTSWDTPGEFSAAGIPGVLVSNGLTSCNFSVSPLHPSQAQAVAVRLTTTSNGEFITLLHTVRAEYLR